MKSYQGLFAQALYLAAMPLKQESTAKTPANINEQECKLEEAVNSKS